MEMIEVKAAELIGPALDWAVAKAIGGERKPHRFASNDDAPMYEAWVFPEGSYCRACTQWSPSTDWSQGGPLIEKHLVSFCVEHEDVILAVLCDDYGMYISGWRQGETHLIAACRAIVAAKLGDAALVPAALVGGMA